MEWNYVTIPKEKVFYITWSKSMQIFKNSGAQKVIVSRVQIELHGSVSRLAYLAESGLTIITFGNCISSLNLRDTVCMSTWWESNIYSAVWNTIYQFWISGEFVLVVPTYLSGQLFWVWISLSHFTTSKETSNIWIQVSQCKIIFKYIQ
jgi:hypothetical protein